MFDTAQNICYLSNADMQCVWGSLIIPLAKNGIANYVHAHRSPVLLSQAVNHLVT
jgi:hypothetical protein